MELEQESEYLTLTKRQRTKLKKRVLHRYHDLEERDYPEGGTELFEGTNIPQGIIREEIARVILKSKTPKEYIVPYRNGQPQKQEPENFRSLETQIVKEDLRKVGRGVITGAKYIGRLFLGYNFALPTLVRKTIDGDIDELMAILPGVFNFLGLSCFYGFFGEKNPKLALAIGLTQVGANIASGIYEYARHTKNRAKEQRDIALNNL